MSNHVFIKHPDADSTMAGDRVAVYHRGTRTAITLNPTGTFLWEALEEAQSAAALGERLAEKFPMVSKDTISRDVTAFLAEMQKHNLVNQVS